jgi:uncharacterized protein (UPF0261 family)
MRTTTEENAALGRLIARKLNTAKGPVSVYMPTAGVSMLDAPGEPFHDPAADAALFDALRSGLGPAIERVEVAVNINDPAFGRAMADRLHELVTASRRERSAPATAGANP